MVCSDADNFMFMYKILKPLFLSYTQKTATYNFPRFNQPAFINSDQFLDEGRLVKTSEMMRFRFFSIIKYLFKRKHSYFKAINHFSHIPKEVPS